MHCYFYQAVFRRCLFLSILLSRSWDAAPIPGFVFSVALAFPNSHTLQSSSFHALFF